MDKRPKHRKKSFVLLNIHVHEDMRFRKNTTAAGGQSLEFASRDKRSQSLTSQN